MDITKKSTYTCMDCSYVGNVLEDRIDENRVRCPKCHKELYLVPNPEYKKHTAKRSGNNRMASALWKALGSAPAQLAHKRSKGQWYPVTRARLNAALKEIKI